MRTFVLSVAAVAFFAIAGGAHAADSPLTGKMAWWRQVVGKWNCSLRLYPVAGQPDGSGSEQIVIETAPGNTVHETVSAANYRGGGYIGYDHAARKWWEVDADNNGFSTFATSRDGLLFTVVSNGGTMADRINDIFRTRSSMSNGTYVERQEWLTKGRWVLSSVDTCTRVAD